MFSIPGLIGRLIAVAAGAYSVWWWRRRQGRTRVARRQQGAEVPVPCGLRRTYAGKPTRPGVPGTLSLGDPPIWTGQPDVIDLVITLDPSTWQLVAQSDLTEPISGLNDATAVVTLAADGDHFDLIMSPLERPLVVARFS